MEHTYFDHAATSPMRPEVVDVMTQLMESVYGNPSSVHSYGRKAHEQLENFRQVIADSLKVRPHEIIFNGGGTEGDNTAIIGVALSRQAAGRHLITTAIEHPAVMASMKYLEDQGFEVTYLPVDEKGQLAVETVEAALRPDTTLVSIMTANNETGNLLPIHEIGALLKDHPAVFHTDAVQAYGKIPLAPVADGVDLLSVSAHKLNGPKGVGFLYKRDGLSLPSFLHGGEQEEKRRAGTENLVGIGGMAKAVALLPEKVMTGNWQKYESFGKILFDELTAAGVEFQLNGDEQAKLPHVVNLRFPGMNNNLLLMKLDLRGIAISTGSACTAGDVEPSHVLEAMYGKGAAAVRESVRISFGYGNTEDQVREFAQQLIKILQG